RCTMPTVRTSCSRTSAWKATSRACAPGAPRAPVSSSPTTAAPTSIPSATGTCIPPRSTSPLPTRSAASGASWPRASRSSWRACTSSARRADLRHFSRNRKDTTMKYLLLIYESEQASAGLSEAEQGKIFEEYMTYTKGIKKSGNYIGGEALQPISDATTVRVKNGKTLTTDGPFAETREQLGGFYLVEAKDLDEAIKLAA